MKVHVCDALCGAGKTSASINMMNSRTDERFIFVTQYLSEVKRIESGCAKRGFISPSSDVRTGHTKLADIHELLRAGANIATSHALFISYTEETKQLIKDQGYILVLDEVVDVLCESDISEEDIDILIKSNSLSENNGVITWTNDQYSLTDRNRFREEMLRAKSNNFLRYDSEYFFWAIPPELFTCFKEALILTYMFEAQGLRCFFDMYNIPYTLIGTKKVGDGYQFCDISEMDRRRELRDKIHVLDHRKVNEIGEERTSLSFSWYRAAHRAFEDSPLDRLRKNLINVFRNVWAVPSDMVMWTCFKEHKERLASKGYMNSFVTYNKRASNDYAHKSHLAYCVNNFPRPWEVRFYNDHGVTLNGDMYALSILIQWVFRSRIRKGEEIWIYIPSQRMRTLFLRWMDNLADGRDLEPVDYKTMRKNYYTPKKRRNKRR